MVDSHEMTKLPRNLYELGELLDTTLTEHKLERKIHEDKIISWASHRRWLEPADEENFDDGRFYDCIPQHLVTELEVGAEGADPGNKGIEMWHFGLAPDGITLT